MSASAGDADSLTFSKVLSPSQSRQMVTNPMPADATRKLMADRRFLLGHPASDSYPFFLHAFGKRGPHRSGSLREARLRSAVVPAQALWRGQTLYSKQTGQGVARLLLRTQVQGLLAAPSPSIPGPALITPVLAPGLGAEGLWNPLRDQCLGVELLVWPEPQASLSCPPAGPDAWQGAPVLLWHMSVPGGQAPLL